MTNIGSKLLAILMAAMPAAMLAAAGALPALPGVEWQAAPKAIEDFTLTDQAGRAVKFSSLRGKTVLVFFGFTNCPDICPTTMHELHLTSMSTRVDATKLQVLMITVDGKRDTPAALRAFLATQSQRFMAMTGDPAKLTAIAARFPAVFVLPPEAATARNYNVAHTGAVYLVDAQGRLRATMSKASVNDMARATQIMQQGATRRG
jgi:protein SCO1